MKAVSETPRSQATAVSDSQPCEPLAVDIKGIAKLVPFAIRTLRRMDASGKLPKGFKVGGRKLWRMSDLRLWCEWGFPDRTELKARLRSTMK